MVRGDGSPIYYVRIKKKEKKTENNARQVWSVHYALISFNTF